MPASLSATRALFDSIVRTAIKPATSTSYYSHISMSRAQLLAGLRTGGPRSSSPSAVEDGMFQAQQNSSPVSAQDSSKTASPNTLKASAAVFTPGQRTTSPKREQTPPRQNSTEGQQQLLEAHFAALRVQQAMALQSQNSLAALYGAAQGQPQQQQQYNAQQQAYEALVHQHQQQEEIRRQQSAAIAQVSQFIGRVCPVVLG